MNSKLSRYSLATLIGLGLGASAFAHAAQQTDTTPETDKVAKSKKEAAEDTIVVTAAKQNLGFLPLPPTKSKNAHQPVISAS